MTLTSFFALFWQRSQENKLTQAAGSLTYSTMLAIVPLIMVVFSIFSAFPVFNEVTGALKEFIFTNFAPSASDVVGQYIDEFVINSIDRTLNGIWQDTSNRPIFTSFAIYWLILTLGPLLIGTSIAASSYVKAMFEQSETLSFGLKLLSFVPFLSTWFIFTLIYMVVPNKKVSIKHSAAGALIAAIFFTLGKQAFTWYITTFPSYQLIYGAMATLPIMLLWIQISWTVVLFGAQLAAVLAEVQSMNQTNLEEVK